MKKMPRISRGWRRWARVKHPDNDNVSAPSSSLLSLLLFGWLSDEELFREQREHDEDMEELMGG